MRKAAWIIVALDRGVPGRLLMSPCLVYRRRGRRTKSKSGGGGRKVVEKATTHTDTGEAEAEKAVRQHRCCLEPLLAIGDVSRLASRHAGRRARRPAGRQAGRQAREGAHVARTKSAKIVTHQFLG